MTNIIWLEGDIAWNKNNWTRWKSHSQVKNLIMLLEMRGRHRTYTEYIGWLQNAGFSNIETVYSGGEKNMIIGKKHEVNGKRK